MNRIARGDFNVFLDPNELGFNKYIDSINTMAQSFFKHKCKRLLCMIIVFDEKISIIYRKKSFT